MATGAGQRHRLLLQILSNAINFQVGIVLKPKYNSVLSQVLHCELPPAAMTEELYLISLSKGKDPACVTGGVEEGAVPEEQGRELATQLVQLDLAVT